MSKDWQSQAHVKWESKYHVVILPKYRKKEFFGRARKAIGKILRDHIHMLLSVPPKFSIAMTMGYLKGKSAIRIHREVLWTKGTLFGREFWARGYCVSTVGLNEEQIRQYIRDQEKMQRDLDQGELDFE
jgi:putative transposase